MKKILNSLLPQKQELFYAAVGGGILLTSGLLAWGIHHLINNTFQLFTDNLRDNIAQVSALLSWIVLTSVFIKTKKYLLPKTLLILTALFLLISAFGIIVLHNAINPSTSGIGRAGLIFLALITIESVAWSYVASLRIAQQSSSFWRAMKVGALIAIVVVGLILGMILAGAAGQSDNDCGPLIEYDIALQNYCIESLNS